MKKKLIWILIAAAIAIAVTTACIFFSCNDHSQSGGSDDSESASEREVGLSVNKSSAQMIFGDTLELIATYSPIEGETVSWRSENESVAVVNDGTVTAKGTGSTRIEVSYAGVSKYCSVDVTYGDVRPVLEIASASEGINLYKGDRYAVEGAVLFNSKTYPCVLSVTIADDDVLGFDSSSNELIAKNKGTSRVTFSAEWNGFSGSLLSVETEVTVVPPLYVETKVTYDNGNSEFAGSIELWTSDYWQGEDYVTAATLGIEAFSDEVKLDNSAIVCEAEADQALVTYDANTGKITVNSNGKTGETVLNITVKDGTETLTTPISVSVKCPVVDYAEFIEYSATEGLADKEWKDVFGSGYTITAAYQGDKSVTVNKKNKGKELLDGLKVNGTDTEPFIVETLNGGFRFINADAYTAVLTEDNIVSTLAPATKPSGYYIMKGDVTADFTGRLNGYWAECFVGTFDGRGHTLNATVGGYGVFGSLGNGAIVKNACFKFTFAGSGATLEQWGISIPDAYCGLAANNDNRIEGYADKGEYHITLDNLRIETTNYKKNSFAVMGVKPYFLHMNDILVELNGLDDDYEFTDASADMSALFGADRTGYTTGYADSALTKIKEGDLIADVYLVTKKFMPIAAVTLMPTLSSRTCVWYAGNDLKALGKYKDNGSLRLTSNEAADSDHAKYFGSIWGSNSLTMYNPYILRYDTAEDLKKSGISKVGAWAL